LLPQKHQNDIQGDVMKSFRVAIIALASALALGAEAAAADLPKTTQKVLTELKLDASLMNGLDAELDVPQAWLEGAKKEGEVVILGTWSSRQFRVMTEPFAARYPFVKLKYDRATGTGRGMAVVVALHEGRVIADVLTSIADAYLQFQQMKALADLRELPGMKTVPDDYVSSDGTWASHKLSYRCMAYNTDKVKKSDLPRTWDDLLTNPRWRDGVLSLTNQPNSWLLGLWDALGEDWGRNFTRRLFEEVKPQRRKESMTAATALTVSGELFATLPSPEWQVHGFIDKRAPINYHCPDPVPITLSQIVILEQSPHKNAARLFVNWILSREGQMMQYYKSYVVPVHKDLQIPPFVSDFVSVVGKKKNIRDEALLGSDMQKKMLAVWNGYWTGETGGGK
jgi:iron(III) transport system substrate-binding protein